MYLISDVNAMKNLRLTKAFVSGWCCNSMWINRFTLLISVSFVKRWQNEALYTVAPSTRVLYWPFLRHSNVSGFLEHANIMKRNALDSARVPA